MRGKQDKSQPQQSTHTRLHFADASQGKQGINQSKSCGQATSNKAAGSRFYLELLDPGSKNK